MTPEQLLCKIAKILQDLRIPYAVTGGFAVIVWGKPRFTADIDIIIELTSKNISPLAKALLRVDKDVYVSKEAMEDALERKGEFNFIHPQTGLKVDFWVKNSKADIYGKLKLERAIAKKIDNQKIFFVSPEDLILSKLTWYKESESSKHLEDVKIILDNPKLKLDLKYIKNWAKRQMTIKILEEIIKNDL
ncbi:MAG: nucleotidyl transferase AbiEii/AbiGii toxin family protein [Patescibacteria group bacterium]|nr:nucleotidyl transferase AbiEii/AbiGii toxin family protein [Patescibacteria group bacterium]